MNRLRLIPVVIFAAASLLVIKAMTLVTPERAARPLTVASVPAPQAMTAPDGDVEFTGAAPAATPPAPKKEELPPAPARAPETPPGINVGVPGEQSPAQKALLERLQQRRQELEVRERDLELRENLIREAEQRLETRMNELKALENPGAADNVPDSQRLKNLVTMFDGMKAKDAARIFDKLEMPVLVSVARAMKPAKLAEVLAVMQPDGAQRLTVELARGVSLDRTMPASDLQRVNAPPAPPAPPMRQAAPQRPPR